MAFAGMLCRSLSAMITSYLKSIYQEIKEFNDWNVTVAAL